MYYRTSVVTVFRGKGVCARAPALSGSDVICGGHCSCSAYITRFHTLCWCCPPAHSPKVTGASLRRATVTPSEYPLLRPRHPGRPASLRARNSYSSCHTVMDGFCSQQTSYGPFCNIIMAFFTFLDIVLKVFVPWFWPFFVLEIITFFCNNSPYKC